MEREKKDAANLARSERMKGAGNPSFGKERTTSHCANISKTTSAYHFQTRKITDEEIDEIRAAVGRKEKQKDIAERFGLSRQYIASIGKGNVLKLEEIDNDEIIDAKVKKSKERRMNGILTKEEAAQKSSICRRNKNVATSTIIDIIKFKKANTTMSNPDISKLFEHTTPDTVKDYCSGKTKLFESEFPIGITTYDDYVLLMNKVIKP